MPNPDAENTYPSQALDWQDLDTATLVVVVNPLGEARLWCEDSTAYPEHAATLRDLADRLDPGGF